MYPCSAINKKNLMKEDFFHTFLIKDTYMKYYGYVIFPLLDARQWSCSWQGVILPRDYKPPPDGPKKL